jgi:hypothetical protein
MIQLTYLVMTTNLIPQKKISHLKNKSYNPFNVNDSNDVIGNDVKPDPAGKKSAIWKNSQ